MLETAETRWAPAINRLHDSGQLPVIPPAHLWVAVIDGYEHVHQVLVPEPGGMARNPTVHVRVSGGVWQAVCPLCGSAQHASRDEWFYCALCRNRDAGGHLLPQVWPVNADTIEEALMARPRPEHRHWHPGEKVEDLHRQDERAIRLGLHEGNR